MDPSTDPRDPGLPPPGGPSQPAATEPPAISPPPPPFGSQPATGSIGAPLPGAPAAGIPAPAVVPVVARTTPRRSSSLLLNVALAVAALVAVGGIAFAAGRMTAPPTASATTGRTFTNGQGFGNGQGLGNGQGGFGTVLSGAGITVSGTVTAVSDSSITVDVSGRSVSIPLDSSTTYHRATGAAATDVSVGATVDVQLAGGRFGAGRGPNASPGASIDPNQTPSVGAARDVTIVGQ